MPSALIWRCIVDAPRDGAANMAMDEALFEGVQAGGRPVLRLYRWEPPCLSLGRNQTARGVYDAARAAAMGADIVRRPTGGLAVFHDRELTYAVIAGTRTIGRPRAAYEAIHRALADGLGRLGAGTKVAAAAGTPSSPLSSATHPCFAAPAAGELTAAGRKIVGSAMRFEKRAILQHGSILLDGDQSEVGALRQAAADARTEPAAATSLRQVLGRVPAWSELYDAVISGFAGALGVSLEPDHPTRAECGSVARLEMKYRSDEWTWRS